MIILADKDKKMPRTFEVNRIFSFIIDATPAQKAKTSQVTYQILSRFLQVI
jgi:hypothetical protein